MRSTRTFADLHPAFAGQPQQEVGHLVGTVGARKHAAVALGVKPQTPLLKPSPRILRAEAIEQLAEQAFATRIYLAQSLNRLERMGQVTATAAREPQLRERPASGLDHAHPRQRQPLLQTHSGKQAGRTAAHNHNTLLSFIHYILYKGANHLRREPGSAPGRRKPSFANE